MNPADAAQAMPVVEITMFGLFWQAHFVVKVVMLGLLGSSIWCWSIIVDKTLLFRRTKAEMDAFEEEFWSGRPLEELFRAYNDKPATGLAALFVAAMREWRRSYEGSGRSIRSLGQRIDKVLDVTIQREVERLDSRLLFLASIGSAGPYIGLFGTVFGIMTAFTSIAASKNTSPRGRRARHRRGPVRHRDRPVRGDSRGARLQQAPGLGRQGARPPRGLRRRVLGDPVAPDRRAHGPGGLTLSPFRKDRAR